MGQCSLEVPWQRTHSGAGPGCQTVGRRGTSTATTPTLHAWGVAMLSLCPSFPLVDKRLVAVPTLLVPVSVGAENSEEKQACAQHSRGLVALTRGQLRALITPVTTSVPRECRRTQGVSTTDLVGRMLLVTKAHHRGQVSDGTGAGSLRSQPEEAVGREGESTHPACLCPFCAGDVLRVPGIRRQLWQGECCPSRTYHPASCLPGADQVQTARFGRQTNHSGHCPEAEQGLPTWLQVVSNQVA